MKPIPRDARTWCSSPSPVINVRQLLSKIQTAHRQGRLRSIVQARLARYADPLRYLFHDPASDRITLHCPEYVEPSNDARELELVERIFRSFKRMKEDQRHTPRCYLPSSLWQGQLDESYASLTAGLQTNDRRLFHFFLANFGTWKTYHGLEPTTLMRAHMRSFLGRRYLKHALFSRPLKLWQGFYNERKPLTCLTYPAHGNQAGAYIEQVFVGPGSFFNEIYGTLLRGIIQDRERPVVADLGAGYGKLAYFILRDLEEFTFIDFDLPETVCLAAYYLMRVWPQKRALLYGEGAYAPEAHGRYDLIFMPSYEIEKAGDSSIDLFINKDSLGEMAKDAVTAYLGSIGRAARYFFHINHDRELPVLAGNERGFLGSEYPVPMETFKLLFRYPDLGHPVSHEGVEVGWDRFVYLYERKDQADAAPIGSVRLAAQEA